MRKGKDLYGKLVCKKCLYKFANRRQFAYAIDGGLFQLFSSFIGGAVLIAMVSALDWSPSQVELNVVSFFAIGIPFGLVFALKDGFAGKSLGKVLCGVQVRDETNYMPIGFNASFKRNLCLLIPFAILVILVQMTKGKRLGDHWAGTRVIWTKYVNNPVFTGAELPSEVTGFDEVDGMQTYLETDNPFQAPQG